MIEGSTRRRGNLDIQRHENHRVFTTRYFPGVSRLCGFQLPDVE
jgi:hypothetical protein